MQSYAHESSDNDGLTTEVPHPAGYEATFTFRPQVIKPSHMNQHSFIYDELDRMRSALTALQNDRNQIHNQYLQSISRWKRREARMKHIIDKQRRALVGMKAVLGRGIDCQEGTARSDSSLSYESSSVSPGEFDTHPAPLEHSFLPPWDVDMDDIRRQLQDIDDSINRVEQAKSTICESKGNKGTVGYTTSINTTRKPQSFLR